jgi:hypothetical protein
MNWLILLNFIGILCSIGIIWRGIAFDIPSDLELGIICLILNFGCLAFNLARKIFDK